MTVPSFYVSSYSRHSEGAVAPRNLSSIAQRREIHGTEYVRWRRGSHSADSVRNDQYDFVGGGKNVGAPTFKVILEVRLGVTTFQNGNVPEVIA